MAAFILVHTFRKSLRHTVAWINEECETLVIPTADIRVVRESRWLKGEVFDRRKAEYRLAHVNDAIFNYESMYEWAASGKIITEENVTLTTIELKGGPERPGPQARYLPSSRVPVVHKIEEVQNAMNSARGRPF